MAEKWHQAAKAAHTKQLGKVQAFALTGDGYHVADLLDGMTRAPDRELAPQLVEARYHDWQASKGQLCALHSGNQPEFQLTADVPNDRPGVRRPARDTRLRDAITILRALTNEFGELFAEEFSLAKAFLEGE